MSAILEKDSQNTEHVALGFTARDAEAFEASPRRSMSCNKKFNSAAERPLVLHKIFLMCLSFVC